MRHMQRVTLLLSMLVSVSSFAQPLTDYTLDLTVVNSSNSDLTYVGVKGQNPGNVFTVTPAVIPAHGTAQITGVIEKDFDLSGMLLFTDNTGNKNGLLVLDPRKFHSSEPQFEIALNSNFESTITSKTANPHEQARDLQLTAATVSIADKEKLIKPA
jgi:hypothetical protein